MADFLSQHELDLAAADFFVELHRGEHLGQLRLGQADADGILVGCGDGALRIMRLQKEGARRLTAAEFLAGTPLPVGAQLG